MWSETLFHLDEGLRCTEKICFLNAGIIVNVASISISSYYEMRYYQNVRLCCGINLLTAQRPKAVVLLSLYVSFLLTELGLYHIIHLIDRFYSL